MAENLRKCIKCGSSTSQDASITLYRFPKPGKTNSLRCELWAKYCFPDALWASPQFQGKLHSQHKMLCCKHFKTTCFVDHKLFRTAVPTDGFDKATNSMDPLESSSVFVPVAGPSRSVQLLGENKVILSMSNINSVQHVQASSTKQLDPILNVSKQPQNDREKKLYSKMKFYMKKVYRLQKTIKQLKNKSYLNLLSKNVTIYEILKLKISPTFALLLQGELHNFKRKLKARRWSQEAKLLALRLYKRSPTCYKLLRRMICLPGPGTLKSLLTKSIS